MKTNKAASVQRNVGIINAGINNQYKIYGRLLHSWWPLSRHSEIPWHFPDNSL